jgi:hypothetical protein
VAQADKAFLQKHGRVYKVECLEEEPHSSAPVIVTINGVTLENDPEVCVLSPMRLQFPKIDETDKLSMPTPNILVQTFSNGEVRHYQKVEK